MAQERATTADARRINQAPSGEIGKLKEQEKKLRAEIKTHEEAAAYLQHPI